MEMLFRFHLDFQQLPYLVKLIDQLFTNLPKDETIDDLIRFGLGFTEFANIENIVVERMNKIGQKLLLMHLILMILNYKIGDVVI